MSERTSVDLIEDWQTGFFLVVGCFIAGIIGAYAFGQIEWNNVVGFVLGVVVAFLTASYVLYGRRPEQ